MKYLPPLLVLSFLLAACGGGGVSGELPTPQVSTNSAPNAEGTAIAYLTAWNEGNYTAMYEMLSGASKQAISLEDFQARYRVTLNSAVIGAISRDTGMSLALEGGLWRVVWDDRIILPELAGGNRLSLERFCPTRGLIS